MRITHGKGFDYSVAMKNLIRWTTVLLLSLFAAALHATTPPDPEATAMKFIGALNTANLEATLGLFSENATVFAPLPDSPSRLEGKDQIAEVFGPLYAHLRTTIDGPEYMELAPRDLEVQIDGNTAVVTFHLGSMPERPLERPYFFSRRTLVLTRSDSGWLITHLHASNILIPAGE